MTRSKLQNVSLRNQNTTNWNNYKYQRTCCTCFTPKNKILLFQLYVKDLNDKKKFWKLIKPFFSVKGFASSNFVLTEKGNLITDNQ